MKHKYVPGTVGLIVTALSIGTSFGKPPAAPSGGNVKAPGIAAPSNEAANSVANPKGEEAPQFGLIPKSGERGSGKLALPQLTAQKISWRPLVRDYGSIHLRVTGPGIEPFDAEFTPGDQIEFPFYDEESQIWADGLYKWELTSSPKVSAKKRELMQEARNEIGLSKQALADKLRAEGVLPEPGLTQSGSFRIVDGRVGSAPDRIDREPAPEVVSDVRPGIVADRDPNSNGVELRDVVHPDDVIIQFSACVGNDCVNGENFGFDTLRLKENNLRIHFSDTSNSASFPTNDWRIVINDSTNGGGNYFAIEDSSAGRQVFRVDAGAPANSLRVDSGGDVGIGTSNPVVDLHVVSGNTPTVRLEQNGSSGFTSQTWDVAGNETNFFVRDASNGSRLSFRIEPGAPQDSLFVEDTGDIGLGTNQPVAPLHVATGAAGTEDDVVVDADGKVGIGITAPAASLHVKDTVNNADGAVVTNDGKVGIGITAPAASLHVRHANPLFAMILESSTAGTPTNRFAFKDQRVAGGGFSGFVGMYSAANDDIMLSSLGGDVVLSTNGNGRPVVLDTSGTLTATVVAPSDRNSKENIVPVEPADVLGKVLALPISEWSYKATDPGVRHIGPMAQDFKAQFGLGRDDKTIALTDAAGVALAAIKGLHEVVAEKDAEIEALRERAEAMEAKLNLLLERLDAAARQD